MFNQEDGDVDRRSHEGVYQVTKEGLPLNPSGRTGACGRGRLGRWGPNHAADAVVTRWDPMPPARSLSVVLIRRRDTGQWALPGGMVDAGEERSKTAWREFLEEALAIQKQSPNERRETESRLHHLSSHAVAVWSGLVAGDHRNTDNAWMESAAFHMHDEDRLLDAAALRCDDDAIGVQWWTVNEELGHRLQMPAHWAMIRAAVARLGGST